MACITTLMRMVWLNSLWVMTHRGVRRLLGLQLGAAALQKGGQQGNAQAGAQHGQGVFKTVHPQHHRTVGHFIEQPSVEFQLACIAFKGDPAALAGEGGVFVQPGLDARSLEAVDLEVELGELATHQPVGHGVGDPQGHVGLAAREAHEVAGGEQLHLDVGKRAGELTQHLGQGVGGQHAGGGDAHVALRAQVLPDDPHFGRAGGGGHVFGCLDQFFARRRGGVVPTQPVKQAGVEACLDGGQLAQQRHMRHRQRFGRPRQLARAGHHQHDLKIAPVQQRPGLAGGMGAFGGWRHRWRGWRGFHY